MLKNIAWIFAVLFVLMGVLGYFPALTPNEELFGVFLVSPALNIFYILSGIIAGIAALTSETASRMYFQIFGVVYALVLIFGLIGSGSVLGLFTVDTAGNFFHFVMALIALSVGFGTQPAQGQARHVYAAEHEEHDSFR